jgi:multidrug resistance efflux pump
LLIELQPLGLDSEVQRLRAEKAALEASAHLVSTGARPDELAQLEAELTGARSELALALEELNDNQRLSETGSVAPLDLKRTSAWAAVKQARVATLEARLRLAREGATSAERRRAFERVSAADAALHRVREQLDWSRVVSPIDGVILTREVDVGDCAYSGPLGGVMLQIADVDNPEVRIEVEESDSLRVQAGLIVELHVSSGRAPSCRGKITRVSPRLESRAVGVPGARDRADALVRVAWADVDCARLVTVPAVGQRFDVDIWLPSVRAATMVPRSAVTIDDGLAQVEVKSRFGWQKMPVKLGTDDGEHVAVDGIPNDAFVRVRKSEGSR